MLPKTTKGMDGQSRLQESPTPTAFRHSEREANPPEFCNQVFVKDRGQPDHQQVVRGWRHRRCLRRVLPMSGEVVQIDECRKDTYAVFQYGYEGSKCAK